MSFGVYTCIFVGHCIVVMHKFRCAKVAVETPGGPGLTVRSSWVPLYLNMAREMPQAVKSMWYKRTGSQNGDAKTHRRMEGQNPLNIQRCMHWYCL